MELYLQHMTEMLTFRNIVDVLMVSLVAVYTYRLLRKSGAVNLFWGLFIFVAVWFVTGYVFDLKLTSALFNQMISVGAIAIIVIFQSEIRSFFFSVGSHVGKGLPFGKRRQQTEWQHSIEELKTALLHMSKSKTGALIVITNQQDLDEYAHSGEMIDAAISARLLENIFFKNSPLHDGAVFISEGRIQSAACILPISASMELPQHFGLRHRAAAGIAEKTDATAIVVSEETGTIALAQRNVVEIIPENKLGDRLTQLFE